MYILRKLDRQTLIIFDNFDVLPHAVDRATDLADEDTAIFQQEELLLTVLQLPCRMLFCSRCNPTKWATAVPLGRLNVKEPEMKHLTQLLNYTRTLGLMEKDNNAIAERHKQERYRQRNQELADAIRKAADEATSYSDLANKLEQEQIYLLRKGKDFCVLGPRNRNAVRLETLGIQTEEISVLQKEQESQTPAPQMQPKDFLIEKRKYIEWMQNRREKNDLRAEDALADAAALITSKAHSKDEFQELRVLTRQTIYLQRDLQTELDKIDALLERWQKYWKPGISPEEHRTQERFLRWCGCEPDSREEFQALHTDREVVALQIQQVACIQQALKESTDQWRTYNEPILTIAETIAKRDQLSQKLSVIRANRKKLGEIAYNCQKAANRRIYKQPYLEKAVYFRKLWHDKLLQEKTVKAQMKQAKKQVKLARGRGERG